MNQKSPSTEHFIESDDLSEALKGDRFKEFLDKIPVALLLAAIQPNERIIYANSHFETLAGLPSSALTGKSWDALQVRSQTKDRPLSKAILEESHHIGAFVIERPSGEPVLTDAYSNVIETEDGIPDYRLVALIPTTTPEQAERDAWERSLRDKDLLLQELQHRVKNNLQMITALIRLESRSWPEGADRLSRLSNRIEALKILYEDLSPDRNVREVDLGAYLSQVAGAVMRGNATEGIRLALEVDVCPVSINIAMPAGLIVNELMTNALKYAFAGRDEGTITVQSLPTCDSRRKVIVADDGVGLPPGVVWPERGKLGALIVQSLRENSQAEVEVESSPGEGTRVSLFFAAERAK